MFILTQIEDDVKIQPQNFRNEIKTIEDEIEKKYCGKVCFLLLLLLNEYIVVVIILTLNR